MDRDCKGIDVPTSCDSKAMTTWSLETADTRPWQVHWRQGVYLILGAIVVFLLLPRLIGLHQALRLLSAARPGFIALALAAEIVRYLLSAASTRILARLFGRVIPFVPLAQAIFAGIAGNRVFSVGGAPGMVVRFAFLTRQKLDAGSIVAIFVIEDVIGLIIGCVIFVAGVVALAATLPGEAFTLDLVLAFSIGSLVAAFALLYLYRRRSWVEEGMYSLTRTINAFTRRFLGRAVIVPVRAQNAVTQFYLSLSEARRAPAFVAASFFFNLLRYTAGLATLYFAFHALGFAIKPDILILIYTSASVLSTTSAVPGEVVVMGMSVAFLSLAVGVPKDIAVIALLVSRALAFWLPIPIGLFAFGLLRRQHYL